MSIQWLSNRMSMGGLKLHRLFAHQGRVLAIIAVEVVRSEGSTGPASVVRVVENEQMKLAAEKLTPDLDCRGTLVLTS